MAVDALRGVSLSIGDCDRPPGPDLDLLQALHPERAPGTEEAPMISVRGVAGRDRSELLRAMPDCGTNVATAGTGAAWSRAGFAASAARFEDHRARALRRLVPSTSILVQAR